MKKLSRPEIARIIRDTNADIPKHDRDEMAIPSYTHNNPLIRWLMWRRYEIIEQLADMSRDSTVLEFGCGMGLFLPTLAAECRKVYAVDLFPQFAKTLVKDNALPVQFCHDIIDIPDHILDHIVAADVLEHVDNLAWWIQIFHGKLKPSGAVLVSGPTENTAYRIGRFLAGFSGKADYHHTNIDYIRTAFEKNGFKTDKMASLPLPLPPHLFKIFRFRPVNDGP
jgi:cyclopropane fatty-acyl-phospholipid synthase-like methyltransferase